MYVYFRPAPFHIIGPIHNIGTDTLYNLPRTLKLSNTGMFLLRVTDLYPVTWDLGQAAEGVQYTESSKSGQCCESCPICNCGHNVDVLLPATKPSRYSSTNTTRDSQYNQLKAIVPTVHVYTVYKFFFIPIGHAVVLIWHCGKSSQFRYLYFWSLSLWQHFE